MNDHFSPVGKPAPPRPRRPESFTTLTISAGVIPTAVRSALYTPRFFQPSSVVASRSPKYCDRTVVSLACGLCGYPMGLCEACENLRHLFRSHGLTQVLVDHDRRGETTGAEALDLDDRVLAVGRRLAELVAARVFEERVHDIFGAAHVAWRRRADLNEVPA